MTSFRLISMDNASLWFFLVKCFDLYCVNEDAIDMETTEETITRQRKKELQNDMEDKLSDNIEENEKKEESKKEVKAGFKYYYNKFRYYHYYIAKKIDNGIGVLCMWIFKLLLYLMGYRYNELPFIPDDE
ncbi:hypothetical protein X777_15003 [Ooceraea biroi]|uniref:Uncharacterized protein n=1 Tax=Ooceraea biroi TaxID=2015173 RepID=A0A026WUP8_OOCBI|nr:hypothetical protein X777_15003 [Ooceraea biroi]